MVGSNNELKFGGFGLSLVEEEIAKGMRPVMDDNSCCSNLKVKRDCKIIKSPQGFTIGYLDYAKVFFNWLFLFRKRPYTVTPGLYFTGDKYDRETPLLVTCNFLSTILVLYRRLKDLNVRLLIVDTNGINVWCSSSSGKFSSEEILNKLNVYDRDVLANSEKIEIIIPKLSLSGVRLCELKKRGIKPIIGPIYAKKLRRYLQRPPYEDCAEDSVDFGIGARLYTVVPTAVQFSKYAFFVGLTLFVFDKLFRTGFHWQVMPIAIAISLFYPVLFPWLPGRSFALKGISLAALFSLIALYLLVSDAISVSLSIFYVAFIFATSIFLALSYTGNSPVSNYSKVKREVISFLPLCLLFYCLALIFYFINGAGND